MSNKDIILEVRNLTISFPGAGQKSAFVKAVNNISFTINKGETLGLVGESGCGKTTLGRAVIRLQNAVEGKIILNQHDLCALKPSDLRHVRKQMQMIFQNPYSSLNPRMTILDIISEPLPNNLKKKDKTDRVAKLMKMCGINPEMMCKFPHEFSGGQRQRIAIARSIAAEPLLIIADEPVSSLDVSVQAQILNLLKSLRDTLSLTMLFISHDLSVIRYMSQRIAVMYSGVLMEIAPTDSLFTSPRHPYTRALLNAVPVIDPDANSFIRYNATSDTNIQTITGCPFVPRCPYAVKQCSIVTPTLHETIKSKEHLSACILEKSLHDI